MYSTILSTLKRCCNLSKPIFSVHLLESQNILKSHSSSSFFNSFLNGRKIFVHSFFHLFLFLSSPFLFQISLLFSFSYFLLHPLRIDFQYPFSNPPTLLSSFSLLFLFIFKSFTDSSSILFPQLIQDMEYNAFNDTFFSFSFFISLSLSLSYSYSFSVSLSTSLTHEKNSKNLLSFIFHHRSI